MFRNPNEYYLLIVTIFDYVVVPILFNKYWYPSKKFS